MNPDRKSEIDRMRREMLTMHAPDTIEDALKPQNKVRGEAFDGDMLPADPLEPEDCPDYRPPGVLVRVFRRLRGHR